LDAESVEGLKRMLREIGYSERAVEEILKWYRQDSFDG
jgi:predicted Ser/Thr protein kinase